MKIVRCLVVLSAALMLQSCAEDLLGLGSGICELDDVCITFSDGVSNAQGTAGCTALKASYGSSSSVFNALSSASCPAANKVGSCTYTDISSTSGTASYYSPTFNATTAQTSCGTLLSGTFTAAR